jgi:allantoinase
VVVEDACRVADVRIKAGRIAEIGPGLGGESGAVIDASGAWVLAGVVDGHVHFNEPGRTEWEGFATGSRALAAGGGTAFVDMPLNALPPTVDQESFELKRAAGEASSVLDFALWGGLVPGNVAKMAELAECGVVGFKAFMIDSGVDDFKAVDSATLRRGMREAAGLGLPVAVHAEDAGIVERETRILREAGRRDARAFLDSRPVAAEVEAVRVALDLAGETGCALHVVHVTCPEAADLVAQARAKGVDVTMEVCAHHLLLDESEVLVRGAVAKCAPPLRPLATVREMRKLLLGGRVDLVGSDHSPAPAALKTGDDLFAAWGGIMGCQHGFLLLLDWLLKNEVGRLPRVWRALTTAPARRLGLPKRGLAVGADADVLVVEVRKDRAITGEELLTRHRTSPYVGKTLGVRVRESFLRGRPLVQGGGEVGTGRGRFLKRVGRLG